MRTLLALLLSAALAPAASASRVEVLDIEPDHDGTDVYFTAEPNGLYTIWGSGDLSEWQYAATAAEIEPGLYVAHHGKSNGLSGSSAYSVVSPLRPNFQNANPEQIAQESVNEIPHHQDLTPAEANVVANAARQLAQANSAVAHAADVLNNKSRALSDCLKEVARLRLVWKQLDAEANQKEAEERDADVELEGESTKLSDLTDALNDAEAKRDRAFSDWEGTVDIANQWRAEDGGDSHRVRQALNNAADFLAKHQAAIKEVTAAKQAPDTASGPLEAALKNAEAATKAAIAARKAANTAREAYEKARDACETTKACADVARVALDEKKRQSIAAATELNEAQKAAQQKAEANRIARLARDKAYAAAAKLGLNRAAELIGHAERPARGEMKCIIAKNKKGEETGEVYLAVGNPDGSVTVHAWSKGSFGSIGRGLSTRVVK